MSKFLALALFPILLNSSALAQQPKRELTVEVDAFKAYVLSTLKAEGFKDLEARDMVEKGRLFFQAKLTVPQNDYNTPSRPYVDRTYDRSMVRFLIPIDSNTFRQIPDKNEKPQFISINLGTDGMRQNVTLLRVDGLGSRQDWETLTGDDIFMRMDAPNGAKDKIPALVAQTGRDYAPIAFPLRPAMGRPGWEAPVRTEDERSGKRLLVADLLPVLRGGGQKLDFGREWNSPSPLFNEAARPLINALKAKSKTPDILFGGVRVDEDMDMQRETRTSYPAPVLTPISKPESGSVYSITPFVQVSALEEFTGLSAQNLVTLPSLPSPLGMGIQYSPEFLASVGLKDFSTEKPKSKRDQKLNKKRKPEVREPRKARSH